MNCRMGTSGSGVSWPSRTGRPRPGRRIERHADRYHACYRIRAVPIRQALLPAEGLARSLTPEQRASAAAAFDAEAPSLSATKKLLDLRHPALRAVTAVRGGVQGYRRSLTLPFPEPGVRLIKQERVDEFARRMAGYRAELDDAVFNLDAHSAELRRAAAGRLGSLCNDSDYPETLVGLFGVAFDFPSVEPPDYLVQLSRPFTRGSRSGSAAGSRRPSSWPSRRSSTSSPGSSSTWPSG
jgi:hypothetical protein